MAGADGRVAGTARGGRAAMVVVDEAGVPDAAGLDRHPPGRSGPAPRRRRRHDGPRPAGARPRRRGRPSRRGAAPPRCSASPTGPTGTSRPRTARTPRPWRASRRPATSPTCSACAITPGRHPDRAGPAARRDAHLRAGPAGRDRATGRRRCAGRRTCTWHRARSLRERDDLGGRRRSTCARAGSWARRTACRRTPIARASPWPAIRQAEGDLDGALELLDEAERRLRRRLLAGCPPGRRDEGAGAGSRQGGLRRRAAWARDRGLSTPTT